MKRYTGWKWRWALALSMVAAALCAPVARLIHGGRQTARLERAATAAATLSAAELAEAAFDPALSLRVQRLGLLLAGWQTVAGCGAGGSSSLTGLKWVGRNVTGGLFDAQVQSAYVSLGYGYNYVVSTQLSRTVGDKWVVTAVVPYLYKFYRNYRQLPVDVSNAGLGDINLVVTRRLGAINATTFTAALGLPTGTHKGADRMDQRSR